MRKLMVADRLLAEGNDTTAVYRELPSPRAPIIGGATSSGDSRPKMPNALRTSNARRPPSNGCWPMPS